MALRCEDIQNRWTEYLYRELGEHEQADFVRHIQQCPQCQNEEQVWSGLVDRFDVLAASDGTRQAPPELVYRVKRQIHLYEEWSRETASSFRMKFAASFAIFCLIASGIWLRANVTVPVMTSSQYMQSISEPILHTLYGKSNLSYYRESGFFTESGKDSQPVISFDLEEQSTPSSDKT
jgi:anti-sigma factor RsiW